MEKLNLTFYLKYCLNQPNEARAAILKALEKKGIKINLKP